MKLDGQRPSKNVMGKMERNALAFLEVHGLNSENTSPNSSPDPYDPNSKIGAGMAPQRRTRHGYQSLDNGAAPARTRQPYGYKATNQSLKPMKKK